MNSTPITFVFTCCLVVATAAGQSIQSLNSQQVSSLLANSDYVRRQIGCVLGNNSCDSIGNQIKQAIPEVLGRNCRSCSAQQAANARKIISFIQRNYPADWSQIQSQYRI